MIYPDIALKDWIKRYPALYEVKRKCPKCKRPMIANKPFMEKHWIGLESEDCLCGAKAISVSIINPNSEFKPKLECWFKHF